jgi:hypothetical protein
MKTPFVDEKAKGIFTTKSVGKEEFGMFLFHFFYALVVAFLFTLVFAFRLGRRGHGRACSSFSFWCFLPRGPAVHGSRP